MFSLPQKILAVVAMLLLMSVLGYCARIEGQRVKSLQAALDQRKKDDAAVAVIEVVDSNRKIKTKETIREIKKSEPEWVDYAIPNDVYKRMRDAGL